jgi:hypothetical protein
MEPKLVMPRPSGSRLDVLSWQDEKAGPGQLSLRCQLPLEKDGLVLKVRQAVPPRRIAVSWRAFAVIELPAGALEASDTKPGDRLQVESRSLS